MGGPAGQRCTGGRAGGSVPDACRQPSAAPLQSRKNRPCSFFPGDTSARYWPQVDGGQMGMVCGHPLPAACAERRWPYGAAAHAHHPHLIGCRLQTGVVAQLECGVLSEGACQGIIKGMQLVLIAVRMVNVGDPSFTAVESFILGAPARLPCPPACPAATAAILPNGDLCGGRLECVPGHRFLHTPPAASVQISSCPLSSPSRRAQRAATCWRGPHTTHWIAVLQCRAGSWSRCPGGQWWTPCWQIRPGRWDGRCLTTCRTA